MDADLCSGLRCIYSNELNSIDEKAVLQFFLKLNADSTQKESTSTNIPLPSFSSKKRRSKRRRLRASSEKGNACELHKTKQHKRTPKFRSLESTWFPRIEHVSQEPQSR